MSKISRTKIIAPNGAEYYYEHQKTDNTLRDLNAMLANPNLSESDRKQILEMADSHIKSKDQLEANASYHENQRKTVLSILGGAALIALSGAAIKYSGGNIGDAISGLLTGNDNLLNK